MPEKIPFRQMRRTLVLAFTEVSMLLGTQNNPYTEADYAMFMALQQMWNNMENPTYPQQYAMTLGYLKFLKRLIDVLPESDGKAAMTVEYAKLSADYGEVEPLKQ